MKNKKQVNCCTSPYLLTYLLKYTTTTTTTTIMKINLTLSLDEEIVRQLKKNNNYSQLVNEQLEVFFRTSMVEDKKILNQNLAEIKQKTRFFNKKRREIEKQLLKIEEKNKIVRCPECNKILTKNGKRFFCFKCGIGIELPEVKK